MVKVMMNEKEIINKINIQLEQILVDANLKIIQEVNQKEDVSKNQSEPDIRFAVKTKTGRVFTLFVEVKSLGQPRYVRMAISQLNESVSIKKNVYGVIGALFLSDESQNICKDAGFGFIDVAGNCFLQFNNFYIQIQGKVNPFPTTRLLRSIFSPKSTRALRVLLRYPHQKWYVKELSNEAQLSLGQTSNIKKRLLEYDWIEETDEGKIRLINPAALLSNWSEHYDYKNNTIRYFYTSDNVVNFELRLSEYLNKTKTEYAFTMTSGASRVAPFLRYNRVFCYIKNNIDEIIHHLNMKEVTSGANIIFMKPYDEGVFYNTQVIDNFIIVSDIQLYLDLKKFKERGEEAAEFILNERIKKTW